MEFKVTSSELEGLANGLSGLLGELAQAGGARSVSGGAAENGQLQGAIEGFVLRWSDDLQSLQDSLTALINKLADAGSGYERTEQSLLDGFGI
jgi:hypothetical protein